MNRRAASFMAVVFLFAICMVLLVACGGPGLSSASSSAPPTTATPGPGSGGSGGTSGGGGGAGSGGAGGGSGTSGGGTGSSGGSSGGGGTSGGGGSGSTTAALAYVAGTNGFYGIRVDKSSNISTVSGSPYSPGGNSFATAGNLLFVASTSADSKTGFLTTYRADDMGALTQLGSMTLKTGGAAEIGVDPTGKFLYGTADVFAPGQSFVEPAILAFSIDQNSGKATELPGSPYFLDGGMFTTSKPVFTPNGAWVCLSLELGRTNEGAKCYPRRADGSVDGKNPSTPGGSDTGISDIVCSSDSSAVFFTNGEKNQVLAGSIGTSNLLAYSSGGSFASGLALSPAGHWLVVANSSSSNLSVIEAGGGSLAPTFNTAKTGTNPFRVAYSRDGTYVFVTTRSGTIVYTQDKSTGALTPLNLSNPAPGIAGHIATM